MKVSGELNYEGGEGSNNGGDEEPVFDDAVAIRMALLVMVWRLWSSERIYCHLSSPNMMMVNKSSKPLQHPQVCIVIVDGRSCENLIPRKVVNRLQLKVEKIQNILLKDF